MTDAMREAFEQWAKPRKWPNGKLQFGAFSCRDDGEYVSDDVQCAWESFQAAHSLPVLMLVPEVKALIKAVKKAQQLADIANDHGLREVEIDGVRERTTGLCIEFMNALTLAAPLVKKEGE